MKGLDQLPFEILLSIEKKSRLKATKFPNHEEYKEKWSGVGFKLDKYMLMSPMKEVSEIMLPLSVTRVPGVKPWVLGVANQRGNLLPIMDLYMLLFNQERKLRTRVNRQRIIVVNHPSIAAGFLVDAIIGIKNFWMDNSSTEIPDMPPEVIPYISHSFCEGNNQHGVFSLMNLVDSEAFLDIAA